MDAVLAQLRRVTGSLHCLMWMQTNQQKATCGTETLGLLLQRAGQEIRRHLEVTLAPYKASCFHQQKGWREQGSGVPGFPPQGQLKIMWIYLWVCWCQLCKDRLCIKPQLLYALPRAQDFRESVHFSSTLHKHSESTQYSGTGPLKICCQRTGWKKHSVVALDTCKECT